MKIFVTLTALALILSLPLQAVGDDDDKEVPTSPAARATLLLDESYRWDDRLVYVMTGWKVWEFTHLSAERLTSLLKHGPLLFPSDIQKDAATFEDVKSLVGMNVEQMETLYELKDVYFKVGTVPPNTTAGTPKTITISHKDRAKIINALASKTPDQMRLYGDAARQCFQEFPIIENSEDLWAKLVTKLLSRSAEDIPSYVEALVGHKENLFPKRPQQTNLSQYVSDLYEVMMCLLSKTPDEIANLGNVMTASPFTFEWRTGTYYNDEVAKSLRMALYTKAPTELEKFVAIMSGVPSFLAGDPLSRLHSLAKYPLGDLESFVTLIQTEGAVLSGKMKDSEDYKECTLKETQDDLSVRLLYQFDSIPLIESQRILGELQSQSWMNDSTYSPRLRYVFLDFICKHVSTTKDRIKAQEREAERKAINDQREKAKTPTGASTSGE